MSERVVLSGQLSVFCVYLQEEEKSPKTIEKYLRDVRTFLLKPPVAKSGYQFLGWYEGDTLIDIKLVRKSPSSQLSPRTLKLP